MKPDKLTIQALRRASILLRESSGAFSFFAINNNLCAENRATADKASKETHAAHAELERLIATMTE